jgi:predicted AAA+ superfamily ATPase
LDELTVNPLKFILFIDDLSFQKDDDNYSALKAILEGSVSAKSQNVVVYATGNRRHLVKEKHSDRDGDDIHRNDTMQEIVSLSERFGLRITFNRPDKKTYLDIVHHLADAAGIAYTPERIDISAERYALARGTRSARAAKQFVDTILAGTESDY